MSRDFTYIDDIVQGVVRIHDVPATPDPQWRSDDPDPASSNAPYRIYNIGNHSPTVLTEMIGILEGCIGRQAILNMLPMQDGDLPATFADVDELSRDAGFAPSTPLDVGLTRFVQWYKEYHNA
jgi:UDP-glucuronate 4-epimerase